MDRFFVNSLLALALVLTGNLAAQPAEEPPTRAAQPGSQELVFDADSWSLDRQGGRVDFVGLRGSQGELTFRADEASASGLDFERSEWQLRGNVRIALEPAVIEADQAQAENLDFGRNVWRLAGNVRIRMGTAQLEADAGSFTFADRRLVSGELSGEPAVFEDARPDRDHPVRGSANRLSYDAAQGTLRLHENVTVREGLNEYSGCDLIYDFLREAVTSGSSEECGEPLHVRIQVPNGERGAPSPDE